MGSPLEIGRFDLNKDRMYDMRFGSAYLIFNQDPSEPTGLYVMGPVPHKTVRSKNEYGKLTIKWQSEIRVFKVNPATKNLVVAQDEDYGYFPCEKTIADLPRNSMLVAYEAMALMASYLEK